MLTGLERFVRLVVERESLVQRAASQAPSPGPQSGTEKSPKVFGVPKPYTGLYSASSYMANRPSYGLRTREPGNYGLTTEPAPATYNANYKLPGLGGVPGGERTTLPATRSSSALSNQQFDSLIPEGMRSKLSSSASQAEVTLPHQVTESVTKTTFTETTVRRVTSTALTEQISLLRSGGPLGLSIIGGSDHSCIPFGTGEQVSD